MPFVEGETLRTRLLGELGQGGQPALTLDLVAALEIAAENSRAWQDQRDGNDEIYVMNANGANPVNLTNDPADDVAPTWQSGADADGDGVLDGADNCNLVPNPTQPNSTPTVTVTAISVMRI
mgnify:CR=1 FL=1